LSQPVDEFEPPYYAVIFSNRLDLESDDGYGDMAERMVELAEGQQGFLGVDSARNPDGFGITVSYWKSLEDIEAWRNNSEHKKAQKLGWEKWYKSFTLNIARVERTAGKREQGL